MKFPTFKVPIVVNIVIIIFSAFPCYFTLLFGFAHLIEGITQILEGTTNPNIPLAETIAGWLIVSLLCIIGMLFLVVITAAFRGIIDRIKIRKR